MNSAAWAISIFRTRGFKMVIRHFVQAAGNTKSLPDYIDVSDGEVGIVVGVDRAAVTNVTFRLTILRPRTGGWRGYTLRDLALLTAAGSVLSANEHQRLLSQHRREDPHADQAIITSKTKATIARMGCVHIDDAVSALADAVTLPHILSGEHHQGLDLVVVLSRGSTDAEQRLLARIIREANCSAGSVQITALIDDADVWALMRSQDGTVDWQESTPGITPEDKNLDLPKEQLGWDGEGSDADMMRLRARLGSAIARGGLPSDVTVLVNDCARASVLRHRLLEAAIPVQCSESQILPMRHGMLTLMSIVAAVDGCGRLQGVSRLVEVIPGLRFSELERLCDLLKHLDQWGFDDVHPEACCVTNMMIALMPMAKLIEGPVQPCVDAAIRTFHDFAPEREQRDLDTYEPAVRDWSQSFSNVSAMLAEFWRLRALYSGWSGYKPGSGIGVKKVSPRSLLETREG